MSAPNENATYPGDASASLLLLTVRGRAAVATLYQARELHTARGGAPASVAGARALGDLSHNVFAGIDHPDEIMFIDVWNSASGLGTFFGIPAVQESAGRLFAERDAVVWSASRGFGDFFLPTVAGSSVQGVGILRATVTSVEKAADAFHAYASETINVGRMHGQASHSTWLGAAGPGGQPSTEGGGVDTWTDVAQMNAFYALGLGYDHLGPVFAGEPKTSIWQAAEGHWVEW